MTVKERFCKKVYDELTEFKRKLLKESKSEILGSSYKTEVYVNLYEVLMENVDDFSDALLNNLIAQGTNILESLYINFMSDTEEDVMYEDVRQHVEREFKENQNSHWGSSVYEGGIV